MDLAALPENLAKGLFDVRITQWHEWHCTGECFAIVFFLLADFFAPRGIILILWNTPDLRGITLFLV
jgi:hypothetical protein